MSVEKTIDDIREILTRRLPLGYSAVLFGSHALGNAHSVSDIDVGIVGKTPVPVNILGKILDEKDALPTLRKIDIVDLQTTDEAFKQSVLSYAKHL